MKYLFVALSILTSAVLFNSCCQSNQNSGQPTIVSSVDTPTFGAFRTSITDHGAIADGKTIITEAFSKAINACNQAGGGIVAVPQGLWITGPIQLKSNVNLHLEDGAIVMFSKNLDDYPLIKNYFEGVEEVRAMPLIYANNLENIAITGRGIFDGSGQIWRPVKKGKLTDSQWRLLISEGGVVDEKTSMWYPNAGAMEAAQNPTLARSTSMEGKERYKAFLRPPLVNILNCNKVLFDGPTFQNSPGWCIHPLLSKNLTFININIRNPWNAQNGDGIDIESCRYVHLENATLDVGDDGICLKSGKNEEGRKRGVATEDVTIKNCVVYHGHGGFVVGSEMSGGVKNVKITDCSFLGTDVGIRFKSNRERGGMVENIEISNINMINIPTNAIGFDLYYGGLSVVEQNELGIKPDYTPFAINESTPVFKNIRIKDVVCNGALTAIFVNGLPEMPIENMDLENINIIAKQGASFAFAKEISMKNVNIESSDSISYQFFNTYDVKMNDSKKATAMPITMKFSGEQTKNINIEYISAPIVTLAKDVSNDAVKIN
jgi:polygalacturonase